MHLGTKEFVVIIYSMAGMVLSGIHGETRPLRTLVRDRFQAMPPSKKSLCNTLKNLAWNTVLLYTLKATASRHSAGGIEKY